MTFRLIPQHKLIQITLLFFEKLGLIIIKARSFMTKILIMFMWLVDYQRPLIKKLFLRHLVKTSKQVNSNNFIILEELWLIIIKLCKLEKKTNFE